MSMLSFGFASGCLTTIPTMAMVILGSTMAVLLAFGVVIFFAGGAEAMEKSRNAKAAMPGGVVAGAVMAGVMTGLATESALGGFFAGTLAVIMQAFLLTMSIAIVASPVLLVSILFFGFIDALSKKVHGGRALTENSENKIQEIMDELLPHYEKEQIAWIGAMTVLWGGIGGMMSSNGGYQIYIFGFVASCISGGLASLSLSKTDAECGLSGTIIGVITSTSALLGGLIGYIVSQALFFVLSSPKLLVVIAAFIFFIFLSKKSRQK